MRLHLLSACTLTLAILAGCPTPSTDDDDSSAGTTPDAAVQRPDAAGAGDAAVPPDAAALLDAGQPDGASRPDAGWPDAAVPDAATPPPDAGAADAARPDAALSFPDAGRLEFSPASAEQGARISVNAVGTITFLEDTAVLMDPASGAGIFNVQVTGAHYFTFTLDVAQEAPVGLWTVMAESGGEVAVGVLEITPAVVVTPSIGFFPGLLPRGQATAVSLKAENITLYDTLSVTFPRESGIHVQGLTFVSAGQADMQLAVDATAPLGDVLATVNNGAHSYNPPVTVVAQTSSALRIVEVLPQPGTLGAGYVELLNVGAAAVSTAGWKLVPQGRAAVALPERTLAAGDRLLLAGAAGVPGGAVVVDGLGFPAASGRLALHNGSDNEADAASWSTARVGVAWERVDPVQSGEQPGNWRPAPALVRAADTVEQWQADRGTPGRAPLVDVTGGALTANSTAEQDLGNLTTLVHHAVNVGAGAWLALMADVDRVAGDATTAMYAVDPATDTALAPLSVDSAFGDSLAVVEVTGPLELRVWADPIALFEPTHYTARAALPSTLTSTPTHADLMPQGHVTLQVQAVWDAMVLRNDPLSLAVPSTKLTFHSSAPGVATVGDTGVVTAVSPGAATITVSMSQPGGAVSVDVPVTVGDPSGAGDTCLDALDVTAGGHWDNQTTLGAQDDLDPVGSATHCPAGTTAGDRVYVVHPAADTTYRVTVTPVGQYDPILYAFTDCSAYDVVSCVAGTAFSGAGQPETITFSATAGQTVFIAVDGRIVSLVDEGAYSLDVVLP